MPRFFSPSIQAELLARRAFLDNRRASFKSFRYLIEKSSRTEFGKYWDINSQLTIDEFQRTMPISNYPDYAPWIQRIKSGESDILWPGKPCSFVTTSGTSGGSKLIPVTEEFLKDYQLGNLLTFHRMFLSTLPSSLSGKVLVLGGPSFESWCGEIPVGSITGVLYSSLPDIINSRLAILPEVNNITSPKEKIYIISRLALEQLIKGIISVIPASLLVLAEEINRTAEELIHEIENGIIKPLRTAPEGLYDNLSSNVLANPGRANELKRILKKNGTLRPKNIWPLLGVCSYLEDGHPRQWEDIYSQYGKVKMIDPGLVASEGRVSVGLFPNKSQHAVLPLNSFIEFLPVEENNLGEEAAYSKATYLPHELETGCKYIPIISNSNGFLRYQLHDVVKVIERKGTVPNIVYMGRLDNTLSSVGEKVSEAHFREAILLLHEEGFTIDGDWKVGLQWHGYKSQYVFVFEGNQPSLILESRFDQVLKSINDSYRRKREQDLLLPVQLQHVRKGSLRKGDRLTLRLGQDKEQHLFQKENEYFEL